MTTGSPVLSCWSIWSTPVVSTDRRSNTPKRQTIAGIPAGEIEAVRQKCHVD